MECLKIQRLPNMERQNIGATGLILDGVEAGNLWYLAHTPGGGVELNASQCLYLQLGWTALDIIRSILLVASD